MQWLHVGVVGGEIEEEHDGYVWQADTTAILASWYALDPESGIHDYWVAVGTAPCK